MKRQYSQIIATALTFAGSNHNCVLSKDIRERAKGRGRELTIFHPVEIAPGSEPCRCEYPGEGVYDGVDEADVQGHYITVGESVVFPSTHEACVDLWFVCPGVELNDGEPWSYGCPSEEDAEGARRRQLGALREHGNLRHLLEHRQGNVDSPLYSEEGVATNPFPEEFHRLVDGPARDYYALLPSYNDFCVSGGSRIRSGETPLGNCASKILSFSKAGDRRPLPGGTSVANEWFPNLGVKISASSDGGPDNMHPKVFDMASPDSNGVDPFKAAELGGHDELGNVLVPLRPEGVLGREDDFGMLNFDFFEETHVNSITLLNVNDNFSRIFVTQADGNVSIIRMQAAGRHALQTVNIDLDDVILLTVSFKSFAAVVSLDLCVKRLHQS